VNPTVFTPYGKVIKAAGLTVHARGVNLSVGDVCMVKGIGQETYGEVIALDGDISIIMVFDSIGHVSTSSIVYKVDGFDKFYYSENMLGCVVDAFGEVLSDDLISPSNIELKSERLRFSERASVSEHLDVGVAAINGLLTLGKGQRVGVMAGSGVGKSVLLSMIAKNTKAEICVCALIGERSREVIDFIEKTLTEVTRKTTIIISAPADSSPLKKIRATEYAMRIAEYYSSKGKDVVMLFDSLTRYAHALREVGLAAGEPPTMKGYPPSVFTKIPQLVERSGNTKNGSVTSVFTVLMDGDDENDPVVDSARAILDGHIMLSRKIASRGQFPAIDIAGSVSRCMSDVVDAASFEKSLKVKQMLSIYAENEELLSMGAYQAGGNPDLDLSIKKMPAILAMLKQKPDEIRNMAISRQYMYAL